MKERRFAEGAEVVQLYRDAPETALCGFGKFRLRPGEERRVSITVDPRSLRTWAGGWQMPEGPIAIRVARSAEDRGLAVEVSG